MNLNLLAISVGNTHVKFGAFVENKLVDTRAFSPDQPNQLVDEVAHCYDTLRGHDDSAVLLSSVNPPVLDRLLPQLKQRLDKPIYRVEDDFPIPIGRQLDPEALVGEDRLLNAAGAFDTLKQACVIVDAGTAITVDLVDGAGTFHGGAIAPGAQMMLRALHEHTALLPDVEMTQPSTIIGPNTAQAMLTGVYHGLRGMVRELTERYAETIGFYPLVVATGGNADLLFRGYELVERIIPDLTLLGLAATARAQQQRDSGEADDPT